MYPERTDAEWEKLLDTKQYDKSIAAAAKHPYANLPRDNWYKLRVRAKRDLFFLGFGVLGYDRLSVNLHGHLCAWMRATRNERFRLILLPRNHFKSTLITISDTIRTVLPYTDEDRAHDPLADSDPIEWPNNLGPEGRVLIGHETHAGASRYLFSIVQQFLTNPMLMALFPDAIPNPRIHRINKTELMLPRESVWSEPTIDTLGVGARAQGRHYNKLKLDDLIGEDARDSETVMQTAKTWFDNIQAFLSTFRKDVIDMNGTRWGNDDLYAHAQERYGKQLRVYRRPVEEFNPATGRKEPIFAEEVTTESLNILRKNRKVYSAQYENDPDSGVTKLDYGNARWFGWQDNRRIVMWGGSGVQTRRIVSIRDLYIAILIDPAVSGNSGFLVTGTNEYNQTSILVAQQKDWTPPQLANHVFNTVAFFQPHIVAIEEVLFSELFAHWFKAEMKLRNAYFNIFPVSTKQKSKEFRVDKLMAPLDAGQLYFNEQYYSKEQDPEGNLSDMMYQLKKYGTIKEIHLLDALAYGPEVWRPGTPRSQIEKWQGDQQELLTARDIDTGYSAIG